MPLLQLQQQLKQPQPVLLPLLLRVLALLLLLLMGCGIQGVQPSAARCSSPAWICGATAAAALVADNMY
jgi:hypothetical protein